MRVLALAAVLMLATLALAGCSDDDGNGGDGSTTSSTSASGTATASSTSRSSSGSASGTSTGPAANRAPTANLTAAVVQGSVPFNVTFSLEGSDPDGDGLTWTLDADGDAKADRNGTTLPTETSFAYTTAGRYNATFTVSDGTLTGSTTLAINATSAAPPAKPIEEFSCTVDFPTAGFTLQGSPAGNFGACTFFDNSTPKVLASAAPAAGCTITFDENTGDNFGGADAAVGETYPANGSFGMECQLPGSTTGGEGTIGLQDP